MVFSEIRLQEPEKSAVWGWKSGKNLPRQVFMVVKQDKKVFEGVVDLFSKDIVSWNRIEDVQVGISMDEFTNAQQIVVNNPEWQQHARERGITDFSKVACLPMSVGYYGDGEYAEGQRLAKLPCFLDTGDGNAWAHPIEGLVAVVDLAKKTVVKVQDTGVLPIPKGNQSITKPDIKQMREGLKPLLVSQPEGKSFTLTGNQVDWQNWNFHFRMEQREGLIIDTATYKDNGKSRKVLYRGSLGGLLVPYGDPDPGWYFRAFMDEGEYGMGRLITSQIPNIDAPANAVLLDALLPDEKGGSQVYTNVISIFERDAGVEWRHFEAFTGANDSRTRRELVVRAISTLGNYDYIFDWVFMQNGTIRIDVGATGLAEVKAVESKTLKDDKDGHDTKYGTLVHEHTVAVNHQHLYNFRLDLDVDGEKNSFVRLAPKAEPVNNGTPRKSGMVTETTVYKTEKEAAQKFNPMNITLALNPEVKNANGYSTGYQIIPAAQGTHPFASEPLFTEDDWTLKRAGFTKNHLWVTPYNTKERYPEGNYPNQNKNESGLGAYIEQNRSIENTDDVYWVTTGTTHVVRAEEFPIMPTEWVSVMLKPWNFFDKTPTLDLPVQ